MLNSNRRATIVVVTFVTLIISLGGGSYALFFSGGNGPAASTNSINLDKGLVGWWKLNGNAKDSTPYGNNGTVSGATPTTDHEGKANGAYAFNGSQISVPNVYFPAGTNTLSVSAWVRKANANSTGTIAGNRGTGGGYILAVGVTPCSSNQIKVTKYSVVDLCVGTFPTDTKWHSVTAVWSSTGVNVYVDGVLSGTTPDTSNFVGTPGTFAIGNGEGYWSGDISSVRIYNRALSAAEAAALYKQYGLATKISQGENGLVGWWKMDGNAKDSTPYGNDGTVTGATLTTDRKGRANSAYAFNGSNQCIQLPAQPFGQYPITGNSNNYYLSVSVWFKTSSSGALFGQVGGNSSPGGSVNGYVPALYVDSSGNLRASMFWHDSISDQIISSSVVDDGAWHQVVDVANGATESLYLDSKLVGSQVFGQSSYNGNTTYSYFIGCASGGTWPSFPAASWGYFSGSLDDVRIYNRALSASEIAAQYNSYDSQINLGGSGQPGSISLQKGLVGYWPMNGNAKDATPYSDDGTVNGATLTTDRKGRANSAYSFNGTNQYISVPNGGGINGLQTGTVTLWVKYNSTVQTNIVGVYGTMLVRQSDNVFTNDWLGIDGPDPTTAHIRWCPYGLTCINGANVVGLNKWDMVTIVYSSGSQNIYLNGTLDATANSTGGIANNPTIPLLVGAMISNVGNSYTNGAIDGLRIYNRNLSAAEVQALYQEYQ